MPRILDYTEERAAHEAVELIPSLERARAMWPADDYRRQALEEEYARLWAIVRMPMA